MDPITGFDGGAAVDEEGVVTGGADREQERDLGPRPRVRRGRVADFGDEATVAPGDVQVDSMRATVVRDREDVRARPTLRANLPATPGGAR